MEMSKPLTQKHFCVGSINFAAVRTMTPRPHWLLHIEETGETLSSGAGGISNISVPKMIADLEYHFTHLSKCDVSDFRRRFGLNVTIKTVYGDIWELEPVRLARRPSHIASDWQQFLRAHIPDAILSERSQRDLQHFMSKYGTECFTARGQFVTLVRDRLAQCDPTQFMQNTQEPAAC